MFKQMWIYWLMMILVLFLTTYANRNVLADIIIEPVHDDPQDGWIDPNEETPFKMTFINKDGLVCKNTIYKVYVNSLSKPARKCQLPDGSWGTFIIKQ